MKILGEVTKNKQNGIKLGYPTANIDFSDSSKIGLYLGYTSLIKSTDPQVIHAFYDHKLPSLVFIGKVEVFKDNNLRLESHILDFPEIELYGAEIEVELTEKLRDNIKFNSSAKLLEQMKKDEVKARKWFSKNLTT